MWIRSSAVFLSPVLALLASMAAAAQTSPATVGEVVEVREASVVAVPPGSGADVPSIEAVAVTVDGLPREVTRVEKVLDGKQGDWQFVVYLDPRLAGARTRFLTALALAQRAESLAVMGTVEMLEAEAGKPVLERTGSWQRIEAALLINYAGTDARINGMWPEYQAALEANGVTHQMYMYEGTLHGFHNNSTPRYNPSAADLAWNRTVGLFREHLIA